jgi:CHAT domain-containing protein
MSNPNEQRQAEYANLVRSLLKCPQNDKERVLAAHPELVDEGLVMTLLGMAQMMSEQNNPESASTIQWLVNFAQALAEKLGLDLGASAEINPEQYANFFLALLKVVEDSQGDSEIVHQFFDEHVLYLNEQLLAIFPQQVKALFERTENPELKSDIASVLSSLAIDLYQFPRGNRSINIELAISGLFAALFVYTRAQSPVDWARTLVDLATVYKDRIEGEQRENIELAISGYEAALSVFTRAQFPVEWAMTQMNLATAYKDRIEGERRENIELAISGLFAALFVYTRAQFPVEWARTQVCLANAYNSRIEGERRENIELAISGYEAALPVFTRAQFPVEWAMTQMNLATAYKDRIEGERRENIELAISGYEAALEVRTRAQFPVEWATTQMNLANAYQNRIKGERRENIELAISGYLEALKVYTRAQFPYYWAMTQMNLALAYSDRIEGERRENTEMAISGYEAALKVRNRAQFPVDWAMTQMNLANAYQNRIEGEQRENIELAISGYRAVLEVHTRAQFPVDWAKTQMNLALAYKHRIKGERRENIELAITGYEAALKVFTRAQFPVEWAMTQMNLSLAYDSRIEGERRENIELAISGCQAALKVFTRAQFPVEWAGTQLNLALAYKDRIEGEQRENIELAISGYEAALKVFTRAQFPVEWAMTQLNLAVAYLSRIEGKRRENIELAITGNEAALSIYTRAQFPVDWATTQMNLASAYYSQIEGERRKNIELAISGYQAALEIYTPESLPIDALKVSRALGDIYFTQGEWQLAIDTYETAMQAVETSRSWVVNEASRQQLLTDAISVYENAIQCAINLQNYPQAIQYTERIRSRQLVDLMNTKDLYADANIPPEIATYLAEYAALNQEIQNLRAYGNSDSDSITKTSRDARSLQRDNEAILALEQQKSAKYLQIRAFDPALSGQLEVAQIDYAAIQTLITTPHTAILTCYSTDNDTHIFIIKQSGEPILHTCKDSGKQEFQGWLYTNWIYPYHTDNSTWNQNLPRLLTEISHRLQLSTLIEEHLTDINELIIVPHLYLHQIPFAALPFHPPQNKASNQNPLQGGVPVGWGGSFPPLTPTPLTSAPLSERSRSELLGDRFIIRSIPSCQILQYCQEREPITTKHIGTIEDADNSLLGARYEGEQIAALYNIPDTNRLRGSSQATVTNYRELLARVNRIHSSHHALSRPDNPLESALILANGESITLGDLLLGKRYPQLDEVFLSACETHVGTATLTDDVATLTTGFLCIGARSVQSTLWSVNDLVTALFDIFYHQERRDGVNRAESLKKAQVRLRYLTGAEFKISYYPALKAYINEYQQSTMAQLDARLKELNLAEKTAKGEELTKIKSERSLLEKMYSLILDAPETIDKYRKQDYPFASPYYWAGFVCQGMA